MWLVWAGLAALMAQDPVRNLHPVPVFGKEYVRVEEWARANHFQLTWLAKNQELQVSNGAARIIFSVNSRKITISGVSVWLSAPIALKDGSFFIAPVDLTTAIHPVVFPVKKIRGGAIHAVCLDPGHGGKDPGNQQGARQEKKYTLLLAEEVRSRLIQAGFSVKMTRTRDAFVDYPVRSEIAKRNQADLFVSLHYNSESSAAHEVKGVEVYCLAPARTSSTNARSEGAYTGACAGNRHDSKNVLLAYQLQKSLVRNLGCEDRGVRRARFAVLRTAEMPAILVEGGFMSHPAEAKHIYDAGHRRQMAQAIVDGIVAYRQRVEP